MPNSLKAKISAPWRAIKSRVYRSFFTDLIRKTRNFSTIKWNNNPTWQNVLDLWNIQEAIFDIKPELIIETGTNQGGSSYYYAQLLDLIGHGKVVTVDIEKLHNLSHPRVKYLIGSSTDPEIFGEIRTMARGCKGPVLVILDSDHSAQHVAAELDLYCDLVTPGSYMLVQDGVIDTLRKFRKGRPGPLPAIRSFVSRNRQFVVDREKCDRFLVTHHPDGWLKRCA
jgi:cephalosporin hydroxylase